MEWESYFAVLATEPNEVLYTNPRFKALRVLLGLFSWLYTCSELFNNSTTVGCTPG